MSKEWLSYLRYVCCLGPLALLVVVGIGYGLFRLFWLLAHTDRFFTFVNEGTAKVVMRTGKAFRVLIQYEGRALDQDGNLVPGEERHLFGGLRWIGLWPFHYLYRYGFEWGSSQEDGTLVVKAEELDYILLKQDVYAFEMGEVEDSDALPLRVRVLLTIKIANPYKALFTVHKWLETVINRFQPMVRDRIGESSYRELLVQKGSLGGELYRASGKIRRRFLSQYGVEVLAVEVGKIDPPEAQREETLRAWTAQREAERVGIEAEAEAGRRRTVAEGEKDRIDIEYPAVAEKGLSGLLIRLIEGLFDPNRQR